MLYKCILLLLFIIFNTNFHLVRKTMEKNAIVLVLKHQCYNKYMNIVNSGLLYKLNTFIVLDPLSFVWSFLTYSTGLLTIKRE